MLARTRQPATRKPVAKDIAGDHLVHVQMSVRSERDSVREPVAGVDDTAALFAKVDLVDAAIERRRRPIRP